MLSKNLPDAYQSIHGSGAPQQHIYGMPLYTGITSRSRRVLAGVSCHLLAECIQEIHAIWGATFIRCKIWPHIEILSILSMVSAARGTGCNQCMRKAIKPVMRQICA